MTVVETSDRTRHAQSLFSGLPGRYDLLAEVLSFGQNGRWRRFLASRVPTSPAHVLDVASGTGRIAIELIRRRRAARVTALDQSLPMLAEGMRSIGERGMTERVQFVLSRGEQLPFADGTFDAVTFTYLLRYVDDPQATLGELARVLRPGGKLANLEFFVPPNPFVRVLWEFHTRVVLPVAGRLASRAWYDVGRFLGPSILEFYRRYPLPEQIRMWRTAGFREVGFRAMSWGGGIVIWAVKGDGG
jgi:demethylmenaquinone methyltransferase/2-methoxy-6-polyprenyl-1,4-benzoquinol methylase